MTGNVLSNEAHDRFIAEFKKTYPEKGMRGISAGSLADAAGYSRSTFYRTFESVYDVLRLVEIEATPYANMQYLVDNASSVNMNQITHAFLDFFAGKETLVRMFAIHEEDNRYFERLHECISPAFRKQVERVYIMEPDEYFVLAEHIASSKVTILRMWASGHISMGLGHITQITDSMLEGELWKRVEKAAICAKDGLPYTRTPFSYFKEQYPWIESRPLINP